MANSELYRPINSIQIEGFTHADIQGTKASVDQNPFRDGHIPQFAVVGVENAEDGKGENNSVLRKISGIHGRSYEFVTGSENAIIWADEYGNIFTQLNTKGNNGTTPEVCKSSVAPSGFIIYGMQDSDTMVRILKASELLRSKNIDTEAIVKVIEPAELPYNGENVQLPDFKRKLVQKVWEQNASDGQRSNNIGNDLATRKDIPELSLALDKMTFFITLRGTQVNDRIADLERPSNLEEALPMLRNAFRYVNFVERVKASKDPSYQPEFFYVDKGEDIIRYFNEYLPKRAAHNFAGLHDSGLIIRYSHTGNISTVGSIYDLDSVQGEPLGLGDNEITMEAMVDDIKSFINSTHFSSPEAIAKKFVEEESIRFRETFLASYIEEIGWEGDLVCFKYIGMLYNNFQEKRYFEQADYYIDRVIEELNFNYNIDPRELLEVITKEIDIWEDKQKEDISALALFKVAIEDIVNVRVRKEYERRNPETDGVSPYETDLFSRLFASREGLKALDLPNLPQRDRWDMRRLFTQVDSGQGDTYVEYKFRIYQQLTKHLGWEEDILQHVDEIDYLFEGFNLYESRPYFEPNHTKLSEQLGWDFVMEETLEEMINKFHEHDQQSARECIEQAIKEASDADNREEVVQQALKSNKTGNDFTWDHQSRYMTFTDHYISDKLEDSHGADLEELKEKYGQYNAGIITEWIEKKYVNKFVNDVPEEIDGEIENIGKARIEELKQQYLLTK